MDDVILLVGNPNAGKSTLFNRLTRGHARVGNWHGVTVDALEKPLTLGEKRVSIVDLPGLYNADGRSLEEKFACRYIAERPSAAIVFVAECEGLLRALPLIRTLTQDGRRCMLVLTKRKRFERAGGRLDAGGLERDMGIPVRYAESVKRDTLEALIASKPRSVTLSDAGTLYIPAYEGLSRFDRLLLNGFFGVPFFLVLLLAAFFLTFSTHMPGDLMKEGVERLFTEVIAGYAASISSVVVRSLVVDGILRSLGGVLCFLPQIALLHLFLILLEESGLLSRLAILTDGILSKIGLSGRSVFPLLMGFGCTAAAVLTTRGVENRDLQKRVILCLPYISCSAKLPVYLALAASLFENPFVAVVLLYAVGVGIALISALLFKGNTPPLVMELAPLQLPQPVFVLKSLLFQLKQFIIKVATVVLAFFLASWFLSSFDWTLTLCAVEESMLAKFCGWFSFLFAPAGMHDWRITYAALSGLIAKENVAGALAMFYGGFPYSAASAFAFAVFMLTCSPCISAIAATAKELGKRRAVLYAFGQTLSALLLSYLVYFALMGNAWILLPFAILATAILLIKPHEKVHRHNRNHAKSVHRRRLRAGVHVPSRASQESGGARQRRAGER